MARTATEIQSELDTVNAALQELISGKRLTQLRIGSGEFSRLYEYQEITYEVLKQEQANLTAELSTLESTELKFRTSYVPLTVNKFMR